MAIQSRRERERADREKLIVTAARELAETEGWDAVTTRRLAEKVEYSQPVLYSHFAGKDAIMAPVAVEGFADMAEELRAARAAAVTAAVAADEQDEALAAVSKAYTSFADRRPAPYDAMFSQIVAEAVRPHADAADLGLLTETFWAALHGLATLTRNGRFPREAHDVRLTLLLDRFTHASN